MSDNKIDRANLRRQAQRVEPYTSLVCKQRAILKSSNGHSSEFIKLRSEGIVQKHGNFKDKENKDNDKENEEKKECENKQAKCWSPTTSERSSSSGSSPEYQPDNRFLNFKTLPSSSYQSELKLTSVMTRSVTRKCATVGALHNRVDLEQELLVKKRWPVNVSCPAPTVTKDHNSHLRDLMTESLNSVMSFCKLVTEPQDKESEKLQEPEEVQELPDIIDLTPYLTQEPLIVNGTEETQITLHLNDDFISRQLLRIISTGENQSGTLIIQEENEEYRYNTITLHSGDFNNELSSNTKPTAELPQLVYPVDSMFAVTNDHTYAQKYAENNSWGIRNVVETSSQPETLNKQPEEGFSVDRALKDLLLNTVILKCVICGDTPQEMMTFLENAKE